VFYAKHAHAISSTVTLLSLFDVFSRSRCFGLLLSIACIRYVAEPYDNFDIYCLRV